jgi:hypothetical protein
MMLLEKAAAKFPSRIALSWRLENQEVAEVNFEDLCTWSKLLSVEIRNRLLSQPDVEIGKCLLAVAFDEVRFHWYNYCACGSSISPSLSLSLSQSRKCVLYKTTRAHCLCWLWLLVGWLMLRLCLFP